MPTPAKCLCICQYGHSRSVAMVRVLHHSGHKAVAAGADTAGDSLQVLAQWADRIILMQPRFAEAVPPEHHHKILIADVGPDRWSNPYHPELLQILFKIYGEELSPHLWS